MKKSYPLDHPRIDGYGRPAYDKQTFKPHWMRDGKTWYHRVEEAQNAHGWHMINHHWYLFADDGKMLTGWQIRDGKWYYLDERGDYQGACWHESAEGSGALERWRVE